MKKIRLIISTLLLCATVQINHAQTTLIGSGTSWKYLDNGSNQGTAWKGIGFNDTAWASGNAQLGYGDSDETTTVSYGPNASAKHITTYFRKTFTVANPASFSNYTLNVKRDDGVVIYINGVEVYRNNMPTGTIAYNTASASICSDDGAGFITSTLTQPQAGLVTGTNTIAVEIHQSDGASSDISFDLSLIGNPTTVNPTLVGAGTAWKYLDNGSNQGTGWRGTGFSDTTWASGNAQLGYGDGDETTALSYGPNSSAKYITTYFRKTFTVTNPSAFFNYTLNVKRDDGVVVYINGVEIYRNNMPTGTITNTTLASAASSDDGASFITSTLTQAQAGLVAGTNTIAVEIHQSDATSSDISFDLSLIGNTTPTSTIKHIRWGSNKNPLEGLTVTWRSTATTSQIKWGYTTAYEQGTFSGVMRNGYADKFFNYTFPTVNANATIYYQLFDAATGVWTTQKTFQTAPPVASTDFSFLALGDSRTGLNIWNQVAALANTKTPDFTIYTGDIVSSGSSNTDWDNWFDNGKTFIENNLVFHSLGNHDAASVPTYQNVFELPKSAPTGGTNLYYSVTYGDAVFIALNSEDPSNVAQYNWLVSTLQANASKKWKVIFFHRPFYTIGGHAGEMNSYYNTWWKAFDDYGVDLIVNGHDHMYERTKPLNRNVSTSAPVAQYGSEPTQGRCQIVCGGAGAPLYTGTANWFIQTYQSKYHFCKFDVTANSICNTTFDNNGAIIDSFCLTKNSTGKTATTKATAIDNKQQFNPIKIVPNPVVDVFTLDYSSPNIGEATIKISDMNGKIVLNKKVDKAEIDFTHKEDMSKYPKGVYNVEIIVGDQKDSALLILK